MALIVDNKTKFVSPLFQLLLIGIGSLILTVVIRQRMGLFRAFEHEASDKVFTPQDIQSIEGKKNEVLSGMYIQEFRTFDVMNKTFRFSGVVWFLVDPRVASLEDLGKFQFMSATLEYRSEPTVRMMNGKQFVVYHVLVSVLPQLNFTDFPLNDHRLRMTLINPHFTSKDIVFKVGEGDFTIGSDERNIGWELVGRKVVTGKVRLELNPQNKEQDLKFPAISFVLDYSQFNVRDLLTLFLPLLLLCYIGLFSFSLQESIAFTIIPVTVTAILAYRFVIDSLSPRVGYFMLIDKMFLLILAIAGASLIVMIIETHRAEMPLTFTKIVLIVMHLILVGSLVYFIR